MNQNIFAKCVKLIAKSDRFFTAREDDRYYITDGYIALKLPASLYDACVRPYSGAFIELANGEKSTKTSNSPISIKGDGMNIQSVYDTIASAKNTVITPFVMDVIERKKKLHVRFFLCDGLYIGVNDSFVEAVSDFAGPFKSDGRSTSPLKWEDSSGDVGVVIMPCSFDKESLNAFLHPENMTA